MHPLFRVRIESELMAETVSLCESIGISPQDVVRMAFREMVAQGCLPWTPGKGRSVHVPVPVENLKDASGSVDITLPARVVRDALRKQKAPAGEGEGHEG